MTTKAVASLTPARADPAMALQNLESPIDPEVYACIYPSEGGAMTKAKLFTTGGSQAVRLPAEFRFEGDEVDIRRDPITGNVVLSKPMSSWNEYFDWVRTLDLPADFLGERDQPQDDLRDLLPRRRRGCR